MSNKGFSIARNLRTIPKSGLKVEACILPVHRKDSTDKGQKLKAIGDSSAGHARPHVYLDIAIDGKPAGRIECELFSDAVPRTAENFRQLCTGERGQGALGANMHFKNCPFHKIIPNLVIQGGDIVKGDGTSGESIYGDHFDDESFDLKHDAPGLLSMANTRANCNSSQFFIVSKPQPSMDNKYVVFGRVLKGMDVVHRIESCGTSEKGEVRNVVKETIDELVAFRPRRSAYICDAGQFESELAGAPGLALENGGVNGPAPKRMKLTLEEVALFHILKKHKDSREPKTWKGVAATCTKAKAKVQVASLRQRLMAAPSAVTVFVDLAREHSDSNTGQRGGDLGLVTKGSLDAELEDAAFALGPGQLSEVIETHEGIHLFLRAAA